MKKALSPRPPPVEPAAVGSRSLLFSALRVLMEGRPGGRWLGSIRELQCVCLEACEHCRELVPLRLRVSDKTPAHLWKQGAAAGWATRAAGPRYAGNGGGGGGGGGGNSSCTCSDVSSASDLCSGGVFDGVSEFNGGFEFSDGSDEFSPRVEFSSNSSSSAFSGDNTELSSHVVARSSWQGRSYVWRRRRRRRRRPHQEGGPSASEHPLPPTRDIPSPRILGMFWERHTLAGLKFGPDLTDIVFGPAVIEPLQGVVWTRGLKRMTLSSDWNLPPRGVSDIDAAENWPPMLRELTLGGDFDQPVDWITLPGSLRKVSFGERFNQSVDAVAWPPALLELAFGRSFDQPIAGVSWPLPLERLSFGMSFNRSISEVAWPSRLRQLSLGYRFNQPIAGVVAWPASLQELSFGHDFNQPVAGVSWPASLQELSFGFDFDQPIAGAALPASLERLSFGYCFNQPVDKVVWPASLQQLSFGGFFNHPVQGVAWPASLRRLALGYAFTHVVERGGWPKGLSHLSVDRGYPLSRRGLPRGVRVELT